MALDYKVSVKINIGLQIGDEVGSSSIEDGRCVSHQRQDWESQI
jgi:hypothetical protein